jgi:hypothetical protein
LVAAELDSILERIWPEGALVKVTVRVRLPVM